MTVSEETLPKARSLFGNILHENTYRARLIRQATGSLAIRVASGGLELVSVVLFARILGLENYGAYVYAMSWVTVLTIPGLFGTERLLTRELSTYQARGQWDRLRGLLHWSTLVMFFASVAVSAVGLTICWFAPLADELRAALLVAMIILPFATMLCSLQSAQQGLHRILAAQWPNMLARPVIAISLLLAISMWGKSAASAVCAVSLEGIAIVAAVAISAYMLWQTLPEASKEVPRLVDSRLWIRQLLPLLALSGVLVANDQLEVILLGTFRGAESAALFTVAKRLACLVILPWSAVNVTLGPVIAQFHATGEKDRLQLAIRKSGRCLLLAATPISFGLIVVAPWLLTIFGTRYVEAHSTLCILVVGQYLNTIGGSVGLVLVMTRHDSMVVKTLAVVLGAKFVALCWGAPYFGIDGAAVVAVLGMVGWNVWLASYAYRAVGVDTTAVGLFDLIGHTKKASHYRNNRRG